MAGHNEQLTTCVQKVRYLHVNIAESEVILAHPVIRGPCPVDTSEDCEEALCLGSTLYLWRTKGY